MDYADTVRTVAREFGLLGEQDQLTKMSSIALMDFVVALEDVAALEIPPDELLSEHFQGVATVAAVLARAAARKA